MPEDMPEVPVLDPLVESGVFNVPAGANDLQRRTAAQVTGAFADDREAPRCCLLVRLGDHGADHADLSLIGVERINLVGVPELDVFFGARIGVVLTRGQTLP